MAAPYADMRGRNKKQRGVFETARDGRTLRIEEYNDEGRTAFSVEHLCPSGDVECVFDLSEDRANDLLVFLAPLLGFNLLHR